MENEGNHLYESQVLLEEENSAPCSLPIRNTGRWRSAVRLGTIPSLTLLSEEDDEWFPLDKPLIVLGRNCQSDIRLPNGYVSSSHASILLDEGVYVLRDHGSTNGTYVNDRLIQHYVLKNQDMIRIGPFRLRVNLPCSD